MKVLDLFSGIGGFSLGLERAGMETIAFCEFDKKAQLVLKKHWPDVPIYDDVRELTYDRLKEDGVVGNTQHNGSSPTEKPRGFAETSQQCKKRENPPRKSEGASRPKHSGGVASTGTTQGQSIDLICGGFPCQPFSQAGKRRGKDDDRDLWPEMFRIIKECQPTWVIGENVAGFVNMELDRTIFNLESENYEVRVFILGAVAVQAPRQRQRCWIIGRKRDVENSGGTRAGDTLGAIGDQGRGTGEGRAESIRQGHGEAGTNRTATTSQDVAHAKYGGKGRLPIGEKEKHSRFNSNGEDVSDPKCKRQSGQGEYVRSGYTKTHQIGETDRVKCCSQTREGNWDIEPEGSDDE
jgi:site-specific DNA-cytosine methylase